MADKQQAVRVEHAYLIPVRHPIKAARMLYSAPSWVLSGPIYLIALITFSSLFFSFVAKKDELVVVPLVLERESVTIESVKGGIVSRVGVKEGQLVVAPEELVEIQMTSVLRSPEEEAIQSQLDDMDRAEKDAVAAFQVQKSRLESNLDQLKLSMTSLEKDRERQAYDLEDADRSVRSWESKLNNAKAELAGTLSLFKSKDVTKMEYDRAKSAVDDLEKSWEDARSRRSRAGIALNAISKDKIQTQINQLQSELKQLETQRNEQNDNYKKLRDEKVSRHSAAKTLFGQGVVESGRMTTYKSTFSGLVTAVHVKPGNNVAPGTPLVTIIKESAALVGRALVQNKDIGRMKQGQKVSIKYFAYPYQEYGIPKGEIADIAKKPGGVTGQESLYKVYIALDDKIAKGNEKPRPLEIGLEGVAEIITGEKKLIELVFSPISRFFTQDAE